MIDRYGEAIERDLADRGWDMADLWRARRFRFLLNLVDGLPHASHLGQARADDESLVGETKAAGVWRPSIRHHDETAVILTAIQAGIENLIAVQADRYKPALIPTPVTAVDRLKERRAREKYQELSGILFPR